MTFPAPGLAVVTGAAGGIGEALARELRARSWDLVLADVDPVGLGRVGAATGAKTLLTDVSDPGAVDAVAETASGATLVCLNAGIVGDDVGAPWQVSPQDWQRVFDVNVGGVVNGFRAFVPRLLAGGRPAHVLVTASLAGLTVFPGGGAYGPSKHAVTAVVTHAAMALHETHVTVSMTCPALVATGMSAEGDSPGVVAAETLDAAAAGMFAAVPTSWHRAVVRQVEQIAAGQDPTAPTPD